MKMEAEPLILPDNTIIDPTQPPPSFNFPKPDFTEIVQDHSEPPSDKTEPTLLKPTFKSALQAKKRLQAFSSSRPGSLPSSPKKLKPTFSNEEKSDEGTPPITKKSPKKGATHDDKAKAVIEEIEELKREELAILELQRQALKRSRSRSRSRSPDRGRFKKVEKKSRNYRRRSLSPKKRESPKKQRESPKKPRESPKGAKKVKKYPKNWREFIEFKATFDVNKDLDMSPPPGNNELFKQMLFESPSLPIVQFKMKTVNREEKVVPFEYVRYTRSKPVIPYSVNFGAIKESCLTKRAVWEMMPKDSVASIENLYSKSTRFVNEEADPKTKKSKVWYPRVWKEAENECKIFEKSVGLSFLQSYTGEEEENDFIENEILPEAKQELEVKEDKVETLVQDEEKHDIEKTVEKEKEKTVENEKEKTVENEQEKIIEKEKGKTVEKEKDKTFEKEEHIEKVEEVNDEKKKKKKAKKAEGELEEKPDVDKKKKRKRKEKKKNVDETSAENVTKKKKRKKDKLKKKEKQVKEKKPKRKKSKDKKKKEKEKVKENPPEEKPAERLYKEQVIEELKEIEEKLAQKREEKEKKEKEDKSRKRKHSDREEDTKRTKHEKQRRSSVENDEVKVEHALKRKLEKAKKMEMSHEPRKTEKVEREKSDRHEEHGKKNDKKSRHSEDVKVVRKRKSRWSEPIKELPDFMDLKIIEEISKDEPPVFYDKPKKAEIDAEVVEKIKETTPDTDEYHSHWESEEDISSTVPRNALKLNRSWESDEELFERSHNLSKKPTESFDLEIPLNITNFSRRSSNWEEKPLSVVQELKLLEEERKSLSEERRKLELEKQKIIKLQEEAKIDLLSEKKPIVEDIKEAVRLRSSTPEEIVKVKKEKCEVNDFSIDSLNNSLLSNVSSTESNFPIAALENEYEEFIKAVSSESSLSVSSKKKPERRSSSSSSWSSDSNHKKRKRKSKTKKKKKKKKGRECEGLLLGKGNNIFNEFDIPVPSDLPIEVVPAPVPVPSPILPIEQILPLTTSSLLLNTIVDLTEKPTMEEPTPEDCLDLKKPFVFSSIVLPSKKTPLLDNSNLKLDDDDSDSIDFTDKFVKKPDTKESPPEEEKKEEATDTKKEEPKEVKEEKPETQPPDDSKPSLAEIPIPEEEKSKPVVVEPLPEPVPHQPIEDIQNVPLPPERPIPKALAPPESKSANDTRIRRSRSRSLSPPRKSKEKRRSRSRSPKRRSPIRRRDPTPPSRRRHLSPRRRSSPRRRGSPWRRSPSPKRRSPSPRRRSCSPKRRSLSPKRRSPSPKRRSPSPKRRSPSPRRRSPPRRRRRSPSLSPPRRRKRTPSPRRRASPLNSPLDGFKRSVADSTISDDMLPQPTPDEYSDSPNAYGGGAKYYERKGTNKGMSASPQVSPKRIPLDDRINLVLGLEKNDPPPPPPPKPQDTYANYGYNAGYGGQYQYGQYGQQKNEYAPPPFGTMMYTQPPPPIVKPVPTPTKVVQVGNILQVVPNEEIQPPALVENKSMERSQKIVQVGNMLQIVPAVMPPPVKPPPSEPPQPVARPVPLPEKPSAEAMMKQKIAERKAERDKRRQERERRRKEKEKKRKEREKKKQMKLKIKTENMIKRAIQIETEALANDEIEEEGDNAELPVQWPPVPVIVSATPNCRGILSQGGSKQRKSVQFADGVRPGEGTSPSGGEELASPPPRKLPKEKRYKKIKIPKKSKKKKVRVKVVKKAPVEEEEDEDEEDNLPPPSPPPGSPPPHLFPSRVKTHTINNVHQYVGNIIQSTAPGFPFRSPMPPMVMNRHQPPPGYMPGTFATDVAGLSHSHPAYQGVSSHH